MADNAGYRIDAWTAERITLGDLLEWNTAAGQEWAEHKSRAGGKG